MLDWGTQPTQWQLNLQRKLRSLSFPNSLLTNLRLDHRPAMLACEMPGWKAWFAAVVLKGDARDGRLFLLSCTLSNHLIPVLGAIPIPSALLPTSIVTIPYILVSGIP